MGERKTRKPEERKMTSQPLSDEASPPQGYIPPELQDHIGRQLRAVYNDILEEPIPDRFLKLLAELKNKQDGTP